MTTTTTMLFLCDIERKREHPYLTTLLYSRVFFSRGEVEAKRESRSVSDLWRRVSDFFLHFPSGFACWSFVTERDVVINWAREITILSRRTVTLDKISANDINLNCRKKCVWNYFFRKLKSFIMTQLLWNCEPLKILSMYVVQLRKSIFSVYFL